jgi:CO dehydrogenase/acetyl-CoA synthase delta subunit
LSKRAALWELTTAMSLLYAGADILIMYHPEAVAALKRAITRLMDAGLPSALDPRPSTL